MNDKNSRLGLIDYSELPEKSLSGNLLTFSGNCDFHKVWKLIIVFKNIGYKSGIFVFYTVRYRNSVAKW